MRAESLHAAESQHGPFTDATIERWTAQAVTFQELGPDTVAANLGALLHLRTTSLFAPYVIVIILIGALGAYAAVRQVTATRSWWAIVAGLLFAGPMFHSLFIDGSVAATSGLALLAPTLVAGWRALAGGRWMDCVLFALMIAGVQTIYPLFVPHLALARRSGACRPRRAARAAPCPHARPRRRRRHPDRRDRRARGSAHAGRLRAQRPLLEGDPQRLLLRGAAGL